MVTDINKTLDGEKLSDVDLLAQFEMWWPKLEEKLTVILSEADTSTAPPTREDRELLEEVVDRVRGLERMVATLPLKEVTLTPAAQPLNFTFDKKGNIVFGTRDRSTGLFTIGTPNMPIGDTIVFGDSPRDLTLSGIDPEEEKDKKEEEEE